MPESRPRSPLLLIALLLLVQFALRVHHPLALPAYVDEASHINRARLVYDIGHNPVETSHGKLLYYFWLGLFAPGESGELATARLATALFSLVGSAGMIAAARLLFGRRAVIPALVFYALAPYALFFERLALADPFSGALAALVAWTSLRVARRPTLARGIVLGLLAGFAPMAKLTTALIALLPGIAVLAMGDVRLAGWNRAAIRAWIVGLWWRYGRALVAAGIACALVWTPVFGTALWMRVVEGRDAVLIDTFLVAPHDPESSLGERLSDVLTTAFAMLSTPMTLALIALIGVLLWKRPRPAWVALGWLLLIWGPNVLLVSRVQPRYLMAGLPALAVLFGGGVITAGEWIGEIWGRGFFKSGPVYPYPPGPLSPRAEKGEVRASPSPPAGRDLGRGQQPDSQAEKRAARIGPIAGALVAAILVGVWAVGFALPFARTAAADPTALTLTDKDTYNHFRSLYTGWGYVLALDVLEREADPINGQVPVAAVMRNCDVIFMHQTDRYPGGCTDWHSFPESKVALDLSYWTPLLDGLERWPVVYVITEYLPPDAPPPGESLRWTLLDSFQRPHGSTRTITVWRVTRGG